MLCADAPYLFAQGTAHLKEFPAAALFRATAERIVEDASDAAWICRHQRDLLPEVERLLDVMRDEQRRDMLLLPER